MARFAGYIILRASVAFSSHETRSIDRLTRNPARIDHNSALVKSVAPLKSIIAHLQNDTNIVS